MPFSLRMGNERKKERKKKGNERQKSVYIEGDTASVDWSGRWFVGLFYFLFLNFI
jgi:hypothetical protein